MRLGVLLGLLALTFYGVTTIRPAAQADRGAPVPVPAAEARQGTVPAKAAPAQTPPASLPATVRRLAESPVTGPARPVILPDAVIDPAAVQPIVQAGRTAAPKGKTAPGSAFRSVKADSANVRAGPSTGHPVVGRLTRSEEVEVMETSASGWVRIRIQGDGIEGWIAGRLLGN